MLMRDVIEHYNKLIDENNDPARDPMGELNAKRPSDGSSKVMPSASKRMLNDTFSPSGRYSSTHSP